MNDSPQDDNSCPGLIRALARTKGVPLADGAGWSTEDGLQLIVRLAARLGRGLLLKLRAPGTTLPILCDRRTRLYHPAGLTAGPGLNLEEGCEIVALAEQGIKFGEKCTVGRFAIIRPTNVLMGPVGKGLEMGDHSNIGPYSYIGCSGKVTIGSNVIMGQRVTIQGENHLFDDAEIPIRDQGVKREPVVIGDNCWIGSGVTILAGTSIGTGSVIGAGAVVTHDIPENSVAAGVPARVIRRRHAHSD